MRTGKFHGRFESGGRRCEAPGCLDPGEFRAPGDHGPGADGPGDFRWFCLDHVRQFNAGYNWFDGMSADEIMEAQSPAAGWANETRAFRPDAGIYGTPRWADFEDPLDAIGARAESIREWVRASTRKRKLSPEDLRFTKSERAALEAMELPSTVELAELRRRYSELVRRFHPDRNGGDRRHEAQLQQVVEAYKLLRRADAFEE